MAFPELAFLLFFSFIVFLAMGNSLMIISLIQELFGLAAPKMKSRYCYIPSSPSLLGSELGPMLVNP